MVESLKKEGLIREFYTFVDASKIIACVDSWKTRDKAIADAQNNEEELIGKVKVYFQALMQAFVHNVKRLITIRVEAIPIH